MAWTLEAGVMKVLGCQPSTKVNEAVAASGNQMLFVNAETGMVITLRNHDQHMDYEITEPAA